MYGESVVKIIIWRGEKRKKYNGAENKKEGGGGGQVHLIKLHNLKYNAHDKNFKMILAIGCIDMS